MKHGFPPLHKITDVDTKVVAARIKPYSKSLKHLAQEFKLEELKMSTGGAELWDLVRERNKQAQKKMAAYCEQDVQTLEKLYLEFRPLLKNSETANYSIRQEGLSCDTCGSHNLSKNGTRMQKSGRQQRYICGDCGSSMYLKKNNKVTVGGV